MWVVTLIAIYLMWVIQYVWKSRKILDLSRRLPNPYISLPFIGHSYLFLGTDKDRMDSFRMLGYESIKNDGLAGVWLGHTFYIVLSNASVAEILLKNFLGKTDLINLTRTLIGNGSIFAPVEIWRPRRKLIAPTFSPKNLRHFFDTFNNQSVLLANNLESRAGTGAFSIWKYITAYTIESVCETALGVNMKAHRKQEFLKSFDCYLETVAARILQPWLRSDLLCKLMPIHREMIYHRNVIWDFIDEIIKLKREEAKNRDLGINKKADNMKTFLELLIESENENVHSDLELREEILVIVLAGYDTSAVGISFVASMLSRYPEVQQRVYEELQQVFGYSDRPVTSADMAELKYLGAVIKETLRLYPPVPITVRSIDEDLQLPSGITLAKDTGVLMNIWAMHRNLGYWGPDAEEFNPDRFLQGALKHPYAFIPFSAGPRNCVGYQYAMMSMKTVMATLLRHYKFLPADSSSSMSKEIAVEFKLMLRSSDEFVLRIEKR